LKPDAFRIFISVYHDAPEALITAGHHRYSLDNRKSVLRFYSFFGSQVIRTIVRSAQIDSSFHDWRVSLPKPSLYCGPDRRRWENEYCVRLRTIALISADFVRSKVTTGPAQHGSGMAGAALLEVLLDFT
jgi:hypothetical protein